jgi:hypothetical protein
MSYPEEVRLEGADFDRAKSHAADASKQIHELARLVAQTLGRADILDGSRTIGVEIRLPAASPAAFTYCDYTTGECLFVYDDFKGICRPCGPGDSGCTPHPHVAPDPE